jgi:hypothetical protein
MIKFIFLIIPFILILLFFIFRKRRKSISFEIKYGLKCYSCKEDLEEDNILNWTRTVSGEYGVKEVIKICKICNREEKFNIIHNKININRIKRFLLSKKSEKIQYIILTLSVLFIFIDAILIYRYNIRWFWVFSNITNLIFWSIFFLRYHVTTIKKPSEN